MGGAGVSAAANESDGGNVAPKDDEIDIEPSGWE